MKIKKKDLRKGLAQLPINYPDPDVAPEALPGGAIDLDAELVAVELLCKRLAHNEVVVRDAVLAEVPRYLARVTEAMRDMETEYETEIEDVTAYFAAHPKRSSPYLYHNLPQALQVYRERAQQEERKDSRREALRTLREQREQERLERENAGRYGAAVSHSAVDRDDESEEEEAAGEHPRRRRRTRRHTDDDDDEAVEQTVNEHRDRYAVWMAAWCDLELVFLKLCRGLHYCLWHSDKPLVQLECAQRIADLIQAPLTDRCKVLFYGSLLRVLSREWRTIDRYRMDKYMALVRKMLFALFTFIKDMEAKEAIVATTEAVIEANRPKVANPMKKLKRAAKTTASPSKAGRKRTAAEAEVEETEADSDAAAASRASSSTDGPAGRLTAFALSGKVVDEAYGNKPVTSRCLRELFFILGMQIIPVTNSIGMTMHICDVVFDELNRAALPVELFLAFSAGIPLYAMSQGNFVEKRVLDNFFPPIAGGVLQAKRQEQLKEAMLKTERQRSRKKVTLTETERANVDDMAGVAAAQQTNLIVRGLAGQCQLFSVVTGTSRLVRVMFTEAELVLRQTADPESYVALSKSSQHRRLERELDDVNETRRRVREERTATRQLGKQKSFDVVKKKVKAIHADRSAKGKKVDLKELKKRVMSEVREGKKSKKVVRDTKRKKNYKLTKKDLMGDADDE